MENWHEVGCWQGMCRLLAVDGTGEGLEGTVGAIVLRGTKGTDQAARDGGKRLELPRMEKKKVHAS